MDRLARADAGAEPPDRVPRPHPATRGARVPAAGGPQLRLEEGAGRLPRAPDARPPRGAATDRLDAPRGRARDAGAALEQRLRSARPRREGGARPDPRARARAHADARPARDARSDLPVRPDHDRAQPEAGRRRVGGAAVSDDPVAELRRQISALDREILTAVNRRLELVAELEAYKDEHGLDFLDPEREQTMLAALERENPGPLSDEGVRALLHA